ncbi:RNA 2',3'-cyclic phosphodiesterase [Heyndrickxia ginsengihumi]|uniref:RNA 2',3'-cyclic phosphodiesterase n=1 Tax=Heyndrickxia ginsengihumi TaxID=363870 RepID=A0A0A6VH29_9BACI|nr:RNA 2',3'-cyclic phosphodiesterase [Heyndrickxia ginsengihumi]KHD85934.1 hypothetical protein NG54_06060 [Heyndrickxia ginsengihumi]MBE6185605.1 RNA 2',3'-cyclic phosphodiesterase [Bacillus sp. (in: firmicutes)]MCM3022074.1 RNA 2',3'-cyclic phosphodiesterase [Heyndrickxia ginsengihumi]NEY20993.1 RNA 2',3'-cyclic phosphodiesterase [Heyndrickxia ginsengihumi]
MSNHYFLAALLPNEMKKSLWQVTQQMQQELNFKSWVYKEDYHITLAFLGEASQEQLEQVNTDILHDIKRIPSFTLKIDHFGTFGNSNKPRILWAGIEQSHELMELQKMIYHHCLRAGFQLDRRPFNPHITLARKWRDEKAFQQDVLSTYRTDTQQSFIIEQAVLYQTHLDQLPKYEVKKQFVLG